MTIRIGSHEYEVIYQDIVLIDGEEVFGKVDFNIDVIHISNTMTDTRKFTTLIHEIIHCILEEIGNPFVELMDEERYVKPFANMLSQVLIDNELTESV